MRRKVRGYELCLAKVAAKGASISTCMRIQYKTLCTVSDNVQYCYVVVILLLYLRVMVRYQRDVHVVNRQHSNGENKRIVGMNGCSIGFCQAKSQGHG